MLKIPNLFRDDNVPLGEPVSDCVKVPIIGEQPGGDFYFSTTVLPKIGQLVYVDKDKDREACDGFDYSIIHTVSGYFGDGDIILDNQYGTPPWACYFDKDDVVTIMGPILSTLNEGDKIRATYYSDEECFLNQKPGTTDWFRLKEGSCNRFLMRSNNGRYEQKLGFWIIHEVQRG